jgi:hypothetical protein
VPVREHDEIHRNWCDVPTGILVKVKHKRFTLAIIGRASKSSFALRRIQEVADGVFLLLLNRRLAVLVPRVFCPTNSSVG